MKDQTSSNSTTTPLLVIATSDGAYKNYKACLIFLCPVQCVELETLLAD